MSKVLTVSTSEFMNQTETPKRKQNISVLKQNCWQLLATNVGAICCFWTEALKKK